MTQGRVNMGDLLHLYNGLEVLGQVLLDDAWALAAKYSIYVQEEEFHCGSSVGTCRRPWRPGRLSPQTVSTSIDLNIYRPAMTSIPPTLDQFYVNGGWVNSSSGMTMPCINPATEKQYGTISLASPEDVGNAVNAATAAFATFSMTTKAERIALLERLLAVYMERCCTPLSNPLSFTPYERFGLHLALHGRVVDPCLFPLFLSHCRHDCTLSAVTRRWLKPFRRRWERQLPCPALPRLPTGNKFPLC
jgi:hypothetical protein